MLILVFLARNGRLAQTSDDLRAPDDCTLGFVINNRLGVNLTHSNLLHSHLESLSELKQSSLTRQVKHFGFCRIAVTLSNLIVRAGNVQLPIAYRFVFEKKRVQVRTVARKSSTGGLYVRAAGA